MSAIPEARSAENDDKEPASTSPGGNSATVADGRAIAIDHIEAPPQFAEILQKVIAETGKGYGALMRDMFRYCLGRNRLTTEEYLNLRLYDDACSADEKAAFVGIAKSRKIWTQVYKNSRTVGTIIDKLAGESLFRGAGFPVVRTLASCNLKMELPGIASIESEAALEGFFTVHSGQQLFGKPTNLNQSIGSLAIESSDVANGTIQLAGGKAITISELWKTIESEFKDGYLFQERLAAHPDIVRVCGERIATARLLTIVQNGAPEIISAAWKIPGGTNVADNFWRSGNMLATVDMETGTVNEAIRGVGIMKQTVFAHPDTNIAIAGFKLPDWEAAKALAIRASHLLGDTWMIGWDIAFTPDGPVIVEANETPDLLIMQYAHGKGIMSPRFVEFMEWVGQKNAEIRNATRQKANRNSRNEATRLLGGATKF